MALSSKYTCKKNSEINPDSPVNIEICFNTFMKKPVRLVACNTGSNG